jgi:lambda family phage portal protein
MREYERVPAEQVMHLFVPDWPEQIRGIPWMHAAMVRLYHLGGFEEASVINARIGASKIAAIQTPEGEATADMATGQDAEGNLLTDIEPGQYWNLPAGSTLASFNPQFPDAAVEPFIRSCLRGVSSGLGMAYHSLANDPAQVNYSTARVALLEERDHWMTLQEWYVEHFCQRDFETWLRAEIMRGTFPAGYWQHRMQIRWQPKRWQWVDPEKDAKAKELMLALRLTSRSRILTELGEDVEEVFHEISQDEQLAASLGIELDPQPKGGAMSGRPSNADESEDSQTAAS